MDQPPAPEIFVSYRQRGRWTNQMFRIARTETDPMAMVSEKKQEIGIRIALGASSRQLLGWVLRRTSTLIVVGIALGLGGAIALARTMRSFLFEVSPYDTQTLLATAGILVAVTLGAAFGPARRATRIDPVETFK